jgi:tRNA (guanine37-N1)-methyltransferase
MAEIASAPGWILVAGRYEGIDERLIEDCVDEEWSIGDYVLSGGELPAMVVIDAVTRLLPGTLGHSDSAGRDSHTNGLLDCPHYTRPERILGREVPKVLLSGDHQEIERWRLQQSLGRTWQRRPDLLRERGMNDVERRLLDDYLREASRQSSCVGSEQK